MKTCKFCNAEIVKKYNVFCNSSCAAKFNNRAFPTRRVRTKKCKHCGVLILKSHTYCPDCIKEKRHCFTRGEIKSKPEMDNRTIYSFIVKRNKDANQYVQIRQHARMVKSPRGKSCEHCGYNKHVECCHIKDICDFPVETKLSEVNSPDNLVLLCPNCHWEFDRGILINSSGLWHY